MKKENKSKNIHIIVSTKGGCGKTTFSSILSTLLYLENKEKKIQVFELDDNNSTMINSNFLSHSSLRLKDSELALDNIQFNSLSSEDVISIADAGGGNDTRILLQKLPEIDLSGLNYYIPSNDDMDQIGNIKDSIELIRKFDKNGKINLILNRCLSLEKDDIQKQFRNIFGDDELGIKSEIENIQVDSVYFVPNSSIFSILKSHYKVALLDSYLQSVELIINIDTYRQEWIKEGQEIFKANNKKYRFAKMVVELISQLEPLKKAF